MTEKDVVDRALSACALPILYKLGAGGRRPRAKTPADDAGFCDCSGFIAWCFGVDRKTDHPWYKNQNGGWLETTAIMRDARVPFGMFDEIPEGLVRPGVVIVYGDRKEHMAVSGGTRHVQGHVGIVRSISPLRIIHCSRTNQRLARQRAVAESDAQVFKAHHAIFARCGIIDPS